MRSRPPGCMSESGRRRPAAQFSGRLARDLPEDFVVGSPCRCGGVRVPTAPRCAWRDIRSVHDGHRRQPTVRWRDPPPGCAPGRRTGGRRGRTRRRGTPAAPVPCGPARWGALVSGHPAPTPRPAPRTGGAPERDPVGPGREVGGGPAAGSLHDVRPPTARCRPGACPQRPHPGGGPGCHRDRAARHPYREEGHPGGAPGHGDPRARQSATGPGHVDEDPLRHAGGGPHLTRHPGSPACDPDVRPRPWQVLHVRDVVDQAERHPRRRRHRTSHPDPGSRDGQAAQQSACRTGDDGCPGSRTDPRGARCRVRHGRRHARLARTGQSADPEPRRLGGARGVRLPTHGLVRSSPQSTSRGAIPARRRTNACAPGVSSPPWTGSSGTSLRVWHSAAHRDPSNGPSGCCACASASWTERSGRWSGSANASVSPGNGSARSWCA